MENEIGLISVVIPALNEEKLIASCLKSLREQDYNGEYEIIIADNGSTDETLNIAAGFGVKIIHCSERKSVFYARQAGADAADGEVVIQADADTVYPRDWLRKIASRFASHPGVIAVVGRFIYKAPPFWARVEYALRSAANFLSVIFLGRPLVISGATFAFRRRCFVEGNGYRGLVYSADQYGIAGRLSKQGKIYYDRSLYVITSARSVKKPFVVIIADFVTNLYRWAAFCAGNLYESANRTTRRRVATRLFPIGTCVILFVVYGYFIPQSPVFGKVYYEGKPLEKTVALTFDDGPNEPYTSQILNILKQYDVPATFFLIGKNVELYPDTARRIVAEGHVIGNHSYSHLANHALTGFGYRDVALAQRTISELVGVNPHLYRPPHGKKTPWELQEIKKDGLIEITWSVSTNDQNIKSPEAFAQKIVEKVDPGEIILLHDGYGTSHNVPKADKSLVVKALPMIIIPLQARGFRFTTVSELLKVTAYQND